MYSGNFHFRCNLTLVYHSAPSSSASNAIRQPIQRLVWHVNIHYYIFSYTKKDISRLHTCFDKLHVLFTLQIGMYCKRRDEKNNYDYMCVMKKRKQECTPENRMIEEKKVEESK